MTDFLVLRQLAHLVSLLWAICVQIEIFNNFLRLGYVLVQKLTFKNKPTVRNTHWSETCDN